MKESFSTSVGTVEVTFDEQSRIVTAYRYDADRRPVSAAIESWDHIDLADVLSRQAGVPVGEAREIDAAFRARLRVHTEPRLAAQQQTSSRTPASFGALEKAGIALRFVAVLLDAVIVFFPLGIIVGLLSGGGHAETGEGYANAGIDFGGGAFWLLLVLVLGYYVFCESAAGATIGKRLVGIRVVGEDGELPTFGAAIVRNLLRFVDCLFFYLVGGLFALASPLGQRLGDRAAHTLVVRA